MTSTSEYGFALSFDEMRRIAEAQLRDNNSRIHAKIMNEIGKKFITMVKLRENEERKTGKKRNRIYVPYALESDQKYELQRSYRDFDVISATNEFSSAALARSASICVGEAMLAYAPHNERDVVAFGLSLRTLVMRNREWMHLCQAGNDPQLYASHLQEDQALMSIFKSLTHKRKNIPLMLRKYLMGEIIPACTVAHKCTRKANVAVMVLDRVDTNYRQLTMYMQRHGVKVLFFAIPASKNMELRIDGPFPELGGHIVHRGDVVHILFDGDIANQMAFTHKNYVELVARVRIIDQGCTYIKEMVSRRGGHAVYKITCSPGEHTDPVPAYKSWVDPAWRDFYVMSVPVLARFGNMHTTKNWEVKRVWIRKEIIDEVMEALLAVDGEAKMSEVAISRLFSKAYSFVTAGQMTRHEFPLTLQQQTYAFSVLFAQAFMRKYRAGAIASTIAPLARESAKMSEMSVLSILRKRVTAYGTGMYESTFSGAAAVLRAYNYSIEGRYDIQLPDYTDAVGYVEYSQDGDNSQFDGKWFPDASGPSFGFTPHLPGYVAGGSDLAMDLMYSNITPESLPPARPTVATRLASVAGYVGRQIDEGMGYDPEALCDDDTYHGVEQVVSDTCVRTGSLKFVKDQMIRKPVGELRVRQLDDVQANSEEADELVDRVLYDVPTRPTTVDVVYNTYLSPPLKLDLSEGSISKTPLEDMRSALYMMFPESAMMDTKHVEAERLYNDSNVVARTLRMKLDVSKLEGLKPDNAYIPELKGHVLPHIKDNTVNTLKTLAKRNADTPNHMTPASLDEKWEMVWKAMLEVFFIPRTEEFLAAQPFIAPNERNIREWSAKQNKTKLKKLLDGGEFTMQDMEENTRNLHLMLKGQLKPEMDISYTTALKLPQTIQYDKTGKVVPVLSAPMRDVVKREFYCYKPNVLVMQRKSPTDLVKFLNHFDHRPDANGNKRMYVEIDQTMFDKSQVREVATMYLRYLEKFGLLDEYIKLIAAMTTRSVSSVKSGVKIALVDQNVSGAPFTLHRNNTVSQIVLAVFLHRILDKIEFILIMGDDVTVAVRGEVNVVGWEADLSRMFNMSTKITLQEHGSFCSTDIIHRADGSTTILRDFVKAMCSLMSQDIKDDDKFEEKYISFVDSFTYVTDMATQEYAINALPGRWRKVLPSVTPEAVRLGLTALAGISVGGKRVYRSFFSADKHVRYH